MTGVNFLVWHLACRSCSVQASWYCWGSQCDGDDAGGGGGDAGGGVLVMVMVVIMMVLVRVVVVIILVCTLPLQLTLEKVVFC